MLVWHTTRYSTISVRRGTRAGTIAELLSANVANVWSSMRYAEGVVEAHERAQGIVREERYKLERQQVWLEKFLQSKLDEGVSIRGHLR